MNRRCACCGTEGKTEQHHVGGRKHSAVTIPLCAQCHNIATITDNYGRDWKPPATAAWRIGTGFLDLASTLAANAGLPVTMRLISSVLDALPEQVVVPRVPAAVPDYPGSGNPLACVQMIDDAVETWRAGIMRNLRLSPLDFTFINLFTRAILGNGNDRP